MQGRGEAYGKRCCLDSITEDVVSQRLGLSAFPTRQLQ